MSDMFCKAMGPVEESSLSGLNTLSGSVMVFLIVVVDVYVGPTAPDTFATPEPPGFSVSVQVYARALGPVAENSTAFELLNTVLVAAAEVILVAPSALLAGVIGSELGVLLVANATLVILEVLKALVVADTWIDVLEAALSRLADAPCVLNMAVLAAFVPSPLVDAAISLLL